VTYDQGFYDLAYSTVFDTPMARPYDVVHPVLFNERRS